MTSRFLSILSLLFTLATGSAAFAESAPAQPEMVTLSTGSTLARWNIAPLPGAQERKTPVIFLHGGPGLYTEARRLEEGQVFRDAGFRTLYFDQAGGGKSARLKAGDYSLDRAVADLEAMRVAVGADKIVLWGNSYGASLGTIYAVRHPSRVAALILTSPGMFPGFDGKRDYAMTRRDKVEYSKPVRDAVALIDRRGAAAEAQLSQDAAGKLFDELAASELIEGVVCKTSTAAPPPLPGGGNLYAQRQLSRDLTTIRFAVPPGPKPPTLIIRGECDYLPMASAEKYVAAFGAKLIAVPKTGHGLLEERTGVDGAIGAFLRTLTID